MAGEFVPRLSQLTMELPTMACRAERDFAYDMREQIIAFDNEKIIKLSNTGNPSFMQQVFCIFPVVYLAATTYLP